MKVQSLSRVRLLATPWTAAYQAPPSMGFSRPEYWSRVPFSSLLPFLNETKKAATYSIFLEVHPFSSRSHVEEMQLNGLPLFVHSIIHLDPHFSLQSSSPTPSDVY